MPPRGFELQSSLVYLDGIKGREKKVPPWRFELQF